MKTITITLTGSEDITLVTDSMVLTIQHGQTTDVDQEKAYQDLKDEVTNIVDDVQGNKAALSPLGEPWKGYTKRDF